MFAKTRAISRRCVHRLDPLIGERLERRLKPTASADHWVMAYGEFDA
jgi:hypothetical protein